MTKTTYVCDICLDESDSMAFLSSIIILENGTKIIDIELCVNCRVQLKEFCQRKGEPTNDVSGV